MVNLRHIQQKRALTIVRMRLFLNYGEHCRSEASPREQSRVLALLNRPLQSVQMTIKITVRNMTDNRIIALLNKI
jgi:hypothetical protein